MPGTTLIVYGASGAGRRVVDIALDVIDDPQHAPFTSVAVIDDTPSILNLDRLREQGVRYLGTSDDWLARQERSYFSIGIGNAAVRQDLGNKLTAAGHLPATLIAPTAHVSRSAQLGNGCVVSPGVDLSANSQLGDFAHVMANSAISHDARIGNYVNVNPGVVVAGECSVGEGVTLGAGATLLQGLSVGDRSTVGAGACVTRSVPPDTIVKGVPAR